MAVTYVTGEARTAEGGGITSLELTTGFSVTGSNRVLIAGVGTSAGTPPDWTTCKWGGSAGTAMTSFGTRTDNLYAGIRGFYLKDSSIGSSSLKVYASGSATDECGIVAVAYSDVDQTTSFGTLASGGANGSPGTLQVTVTSATGELIVGWHYHATGTVADPTDDGGQTRRQTSVGVTYEAIISSEKAGAASTTFGYTCSDNAQYGQALQAISLKPASSSGTTITPGAGSMSISGAVPGIDVTGGNAPVLSLAGVQNVTATSAVPKVTVTY